MMGDYIFRLPDVGEGVAEAEIVAWHIKLGDRIDEDQATVDVMTDKATVEITTPVSGRVVALHGAVGQTVPVGAPLIELQTDSEATSADTTTGAEAPTPPEAAPEVDAEAGSAGPDAGGLPLPHPSTITPTTAPAPNARQSSPASASAAEPTAPAPFMTGSRDGAPLASPATRRRAYDLGIGLQFVPGTGPGGRITAEDLDSFVARAGTASVPAPGGRVIRRTGVNEIKIIGLRRKIAEKMQDAKRRIPHFSYVEEFDLTELESLRRDLNDTRTTGAPKLTLLPFFMRAVVRLAPDFPQVNARYDDEAGILRTYDGVHIGIATQTAGGLLVPVVRHAEALDLWGSARELGRVTGAARDGSATRDELIGSTITLTSLGALGGISATPVINHPEVAIIGPNKLVERPMVVNGQIVVRTMMNVSSSFDHRIVDGHDAARFVQGLKRLIERPALLFLEP